MTDIREFEPILPDPQPNVAKALALYERAVREGRGRIVFISAELGGGKTEHLSALARALSEARDAPNLLAGFFSDGYYHGYSFDWRESICLKKAATAAGATASLISPLLGPYANAANLVGQLLQTSVSAQEFAAELGKEQSQRKERAEGMKTLWRRAATEKPLVCLLDDWHEAQRFQWDLMLSSLAAEISRDLPLLMFITVRSPLNLDAPERDESGLSALIKRLMDKGLAECWSLAKLSLREIADTIGDAAPGIAAKLHGLTGGNARWVREVWHEWRVNETVVLDGSDRWVWGEHHRATLNLYKDILEDRLQRLLEAETVSEVEETRGLLACAALEGTRFTADALARVMNWDRDELIDFLDEVLLQSEKNPDGLLIEDEAAQIPMPDGTTRTLWRYRFVSDLHWMALDRYGFASEQRPERSDTERLEKCAALVESLLETYAPEERLTAASLARLLRELGQDGAARKYQRISDYAAAREVMREQALYLLAVNKDDWDRWQMARVVEFLIDAGKAMIDAYHYNETLPVFEEAYHAAREAKSHENEAYARYLCGRILCARREYKSAREAANDSLDLARRIGKKDVFAAAQTLLAELDFIEGQLVEARERFMAALEIEEQLGVRSNISVILSFLAQLDFTEGNYARARECALQSLKIKFELGTRSATALNLNLLARTDFVEGNYAEARERAREALEIGRETSNRHDETVALTILASLNFTEGNYAEARERAREALVIGQEIGAWEEIEEILCQLVELDLYEGLYAEALRWITQLLEIDRMFGNEHNRFKSLIWLNVVAEKLELPDEAFNLKALVFTILAHIGDERAESLGRDLVELAAKQGHMEEECNELFQKVSEAYERDNGAELIEKALARLREASLSSSGGETERDDVR